MIVVDTNVIAYFLIPGNRTATSQTVRSRDTDWHAPALIRHELLSAISGYIRENGLSVDEAIRTYRRGLSLVDIEEAVPDPVKLLRMSSTSGCTTYDCQFVALAEALGVPLITADQQVLRAFPGTAVHPEHF